jgi:hypothetical protein
MTDWTVTTAGPERHDGEAPYVWVVTAPDAIAAGREALHTHSWQEDTNDVEIISIRRGLPLPEDGHWNDCRQEGES